MCRLFDCAVVLVVNICGHFCSYSAEENNSFAEVILQEFNGEHLGRRMRLQYVKETAHNYCFPLNMCTVCCYLKKGYIKNMLITTDFI